MFYMSNTATATNIVVIPCGATKLDAPAAARDLYASPNFAHTLRSAETYAADANATVMILSAEHGLLDLDTIVAPYDTKMGDAGCIDTDAIKAQLLDIAPATIVSMLPGAYYRRVWAAVTDINDNGADTDPWIDLMDAYEAAGPGIGYQRGIASRVARA